MGGLVICAVLALAVFAAPVLAQDWPARKAVTMVVPFAAGGPVDTIGRILASGLTETLGQQVIVENAGGAGGMTGASRVAKAAPDGYAINKALYKNLAHDGEKDFAPVTLVATGPTIVCVNIDLPVKNLKELIAYAKANPGKLFNASSGYGSAPHLAAVSFEAAAGVKFTSVQFKGGGPAIQSVIAGDTQVMFATPPTVMGFIKAGRLRALAVTMPKASPAVPGIPGAEEAGLPGYESTFWFGLFVPAGTPQAVVGRLHAAATKALAKQEVRDKIGLQGMDATPSASPAAFGAQIKAEAPMWERVVQDSGAKVE